MICRGDAMASGFRLHVWFILLVSLVLTSQIRAQQANSLGKIIGIIRVSRGDFPQYPVLVSLEMRGSPINSTYTDGQGRFGFYSLVANEYTITVNDEAYEPFTETVNVNPETSPMNFAQVMLIARANAKKDSLPGRVEGSNPYLIDPAAYYNHFPKKTLKEFDKGRDADQKSNHDEAIQHYLKALEYSPDFYPAHNNLGTIYLSRQNFDAAETQFEAALKTNQNDGQAHFNLANVLVLTQHYGDAEREIDEGLQRRPDSAFGKFLQGLVYTHTNHPDLAEKSLQSALQLDPKMSQAYLQLVNLYLQQKRTTEAIAELEAYLKVFPDSPLSSKVRETLKRLQGNPVASPQ
jgi:tetratricopeptide (TPR) repeat protein